MKIDIKIVTGIVLVFLMISCSLESKFSLPNDEKIKPELLGEWYIEKDNTVRITILKNSDISYKFLLNEKGNTEEFISFSKTIKGVNLLNIKTEYNGKTTNVFYGFNIKDNSLVLLEVNEKLRTEEFDSESDLLTFFENNIDKEDFFINPTKLKRK